MPEKPTSLELPLGPRPRSRLAWRLLRLLDEEAGVSWIWTGFQQHVEQRLGMQGKAALAELTREGAIRIEKPRRRRGDAEGRLVIHLISPHRDRFVALLRFVRLGTMPEHIGDLCNAPGPGKARCSIQLPGHDGPHLDHSHPALREGEVLRWDDGV